MTQITTAPYGSWKSPITADLIARHSRRLGSVWLTADSVYWTESRPEEKGQNVLVRQRAEGAVEDVTPADFNVRTTVHEYGGGSFAVHDGVVYFTNFDDQRLYKQIIGQKPEVLTSNIAVRYADLTIDASRNRLICIREDHRDPGEAVTTLAAISLDGDEAGSVLVSGADFYSSPRLSLDGSRLAWLAWNHPNMPWDGTELWMADIQEDGSLGNAEHVAGAKDVSIFQPEWSPDGELYYVSDESGWWNIHRQMNGRDEPVFPMAAEFGMPQWVFGMSTYAFRSASTIICAMNRLGVWSLAKLDLGKGSIEIIDQPYDAISGLWGREDQIVFIGASPTEPHSLVKMEHDTRTIEVIRRSSEPLEAQRYLSIPEVIEFPTSGGVTAFANYYGPRNDDYTAPSGELPPLVLMSHGGPTGSASTGLNLTIQFFTSRGLAVVDVNYGGSTGFGRAYRMRLNGNWGVVDVDDCVNAARHLVDWGRVDGGRLAIRGGSAGGYTTFAVLAFRDLFHVGASYFGVSDIEGLVKET
ncbi:MAG: prolyl oligopeptidase family serine peptidase, partial [Candidatus Promineifilaceae bacterium]